MIPVAVGTLIFGGVLTGLALIGFGVGDLLEFGWSRHAVTRIIAGYVTFVVFVYLALTMSGGVRG